MLSKYVALQGYSNNFKKIDINCYISAFLSNLNTKYENVTMKQTYPQWGTLGVFFELNINGKRKFVKTHLYGSEYRKNIIREIQIISIVYGDIIDIEQIDIEIDKVQITFLVMDYLLSYNHLITPGEIRNCITNYQKKLSKEKIEIGYSFQQIINAGIESLELLYAQTFFTKELYLRCKESLQHIIDKKYENVICHGDLSNANIMYTQNGIPIVIDWEDVLYAFEEYDYLYWLTFFSQRKYYSSGLLKSNDIEKTWGIDIMVMITIIKSKMSYLNSSYKKNTISFQDRISEFYNILN